MIDTKQSMKDREWFLRSFDQFAPMKKYIQKQKKDTNGSQKSS